MASSDVSVQEARRGKSESLKQILLRLEQATRASAERRPAARSEPPWGCQRDGRQPPPPRLVPADGKGAPLALQPLLGGSRQPICTEPEGLKDPNGRKFSCAFVSILATVASGKGQLWGPLLTLIPGAPPQMPREMQRCPTEPVLLGSPLCMFCFDPGAA